MKSNVLRIGSALLLWVLFGLALQAQTTYYVTPTGNNPSGDGNKWVGKTDEEILTLSEALTQAQAGDQIWLLGFSQITNEEEQVYIAPASGFTLKSGVKLFGGFEGSETKVDQRPNLGKAYQFTYRSVLSGDIQRNDKSDPANAIFPGNTTRGDNAAHVLVMHAFRNSGDNLNDGSVPTVADGLTIVGGAAKDFGGGIYVKGDAAKAGNEVPYAIEHCYLVDNYAPKGGAIYVDELVKHASGVQSIINQCVVYNNVAGTVVDKENLGGGIYVAGAGNIVNSSIFNNENGGVVLGTEAHLVNATVARNTGGGVDMRYTPSVGDVHVHNSVVWGNSFVFSGIKPVFSYSAYPDAAEGDSYSNYNLSKNNKGEANSPRFDAPSIHTRYEADYNWRATAYPIWSWKLLENSFLVNLGNGSAYDTYAKGYQGVVSTDLGGFTRKVGNIDINAYEFQATPTARIRYVKTDGNDNNDGSSWGKAYKSVQKAINELAKTPGVPGEVWIAKGEYFPTALINGSGTPASFRMYDGISLYGGFAGTESSKKEREHGDDGMPWQFTNETVLRGSTYDGKCTWNDEDKKWVLSSASSHVVWFAPLPGKEEFKQQTVIEGITIEGGKSETTNISAYDEDKGAGVYMVGSKIFLLNSIVKHNASTAQGGGIYLKDGRVQGCLVYNNSSETIGGGIYVDNAGLILRSMITNNAAINGGGVYLDNNAVWEDGMYHPNYLILSTSVISNNTSVHNGAVYCNKGGVILHNTITNNYTPTATDAAAGYASQTGGLYIDSYAKVVSSVLWNNMIKSRKVQLYAANAESGDIDFYYCAVANTQNIIWNNITQQETMAISENNQIVGDHGEIDPGFEPAGRPTVEGVRGDVTEIDYYWQPVPGSNLRARGMSLGMLPAEVLVAPELDIKGESYARKPAIGAYRVKSTPMKPEETAQYIRLYVNVECTEPTHDGSSWEKAYRSLNEAIEYMAQLSEDDVDNRELQVYVMEGDIWPRYAAVNLDPRSATVTVPAMASGGKLVIKGGFSSKEEEYNTWAPLTYRSQINGNHEGNNLEDGLYHCIIVEQGAQVELDGFHIINGYAGNTANLKYGAGILVRDGATVTVKNTIFENNTAVEGAAIDARGATLTLTNCVVNNNTNLDQSQPVINAKSLTLNHVSVVNNLGAAPASMGTSSFAAGNTGGNTFSYASIGAEGYKNFANPTNKQGASLGFDTYLGGYSNFAPLTSSADAGNLINKANGTPAGLDQDIAGNERNLGGAPDLGAYEAKLPANGSVIYVTANGAGNMDGSSWENAIAGNLIYDVNNKKLVSGNIPTTDSRYIGFYDANARPYGETSGASKLFFEHLNEQNLNASNVNYKTETHDGVTHVTGANGINIRNNRKEQYVGGLQYAVELAAANAAKDGVQRTVWVAGGTYTDYKGFVIRDKVDVLGGFPNEGTPGEDDRQPLISQYIPAKASDVDLDKTKYETIIQIQATKPWTYNSNGNPGANPEAKLPAQTRKPVLFQPDVCLPTKSPSGRESSYSYWNWGRSWDDWSNHWIYNGYGNSVPGTSDDAASNIYRYNLPEGQRNGTYVEYSGATWDGFTIRHGFYTDYKANRDGGAGVRMFRGVTLQNCVVTDNYINAHNSSGRGSGIYCDGSNSKVVNCFVLNNANNSDESYGGGMYLILGTSYNTMVANNYAKTNGGGIFIEDAMFYNNTVAFNKSNGTGGLHQWTASSGTSTTLKLYNTIFYGNSGKAIGVSSVNNFNGAWNCYVQTNSSLDGAVQAKIHDSQIGTGLASPFESANAQTDNNFRLNATTWCLNNGAEDLGNDYQGKPVELPYTDVDFTDRIKDCTVDLGAYERSNEENVKCDDKGFYYVTENGSGTSDGSSLQNAACAMKLQEVLNAAGVRVKSGQAAVVKIAGYEGADPFLYRANTLSDPNDPQSYTFVIPYGVTVEGGYNGMKTTGTWTEADRDPMKYRTLLSAIAQEVGQDVNGYHTVTFGEKPSGWQGASDQKTIIDGLYLIDGKATSMAGAGNPNTRGGGAVVPAWAHVRNCVVARNEAIQGGGLYLLPGATVSGTLIMENNAEEGAGIYASNENASASLRAHMVSNTITDNVAANSGGGVYLENGALMASNCVIWGNSASSDKNVSGVVNMTYEDDVFHSVEESVAEFYPFNNTYVETFELPSNFENTSMKSEEEFYFTASRTLKAYSELIKHGMETEYQKALQEKLDISAKDMRGISRIQGDALRIDVGAYAYEGGVIPVPETDQDSVVTRIFVNKEVGTTVTGDMDQYIGRSFYTGLSWLDDALDYIRKVRQVSGLEDTEFEIYLAQGIYKPSIRCTISSVPTVDQRLNSYEIPAGVKIYGGFKGDEPYSFNLTEINTENGVIDLKSVTETEYLNEFLSKRTHSDLNSNGIDEPWEFEYQSILSGDINVSPTVKNAFHVIYSSLGSTTHTSILLDGLTVKDGETWHELSATEAYDERGRGGAIYTNGVDYTLKGCRVMNCKAVRGGAIYARDANLTLIGSALSGNGTVENAAVPDGMDTRGGAVHMTGIHKDVYLKAVNTLWGNNETTGKGGAISVGNDQNGLTGSVTLSLMNNTMVRNKAAEASAIYAPVKSGKASSGKITNTVMWGGEETGMAKGAVSAGPEITYSASDSPLPDNQHNVFLEKENMAVEGPRFAAPTSVPGTAGLDLTAKWSPASISLLTDAGNGQLEFNNENIKSATGAYHDWWAANPDLQAADETFYMGMPLTEYHRYKGQRAPFGESEPKKIDIGLYEYQYKGNFANMDQVYVDVVDRGNASGDSWGNATSDFRGAVVALSNPTGGSNKQDRYIYVHAGEYPQSQLYVDNIAYQAILNKDNQLFTTLNIKGSYADNGEQDFSTPTVIRPATGVPADVLFYTETNGKTLKMDGITFKGATKKAFESKNSGKLVLKNVAFTENTAVGANITNEGGGTALLANVLFADGGTGLNVEGNGTTVVNATFANNQAAFAGSGVPEIWNSVAWKSGQQVKDSEKYNVNLGDATNNDVLAGPNFVDPEKGNYMIRPSIKLLDVANTEMYNTLVGTEAASDKDLGNNARLTGDRLDIGAYEYNAPLRGIIYVKSNVVQTDQTGSSWENPITDLQGAIDLASVYIEKENAKNAYAFVHRDVTNAQNIRLNHQGVKVYGGMQDEMPAEETAANLIAARSRVLDDDMSTINGLLLDKDCLLDGFKTTGNIQVNQGMLSTSVIEGAATTGESGVVYNSFVSGSLKGAGTAVNVTSPGTIETTDKINVLEQAPDNGYVDKDIWKYQLKDDDSRINNRSAKPVEYYMKQAGHEKDLSGAPRVRDLMDAGCFESWNFTGNTPKTTLTAGEMPTENHVVYVREGVEVDIAPGLYPEGKNFNVGFLLLEHGAGLRGNGNAINLTNFAVERNLNEANKRWDMCYMPFDIIRSTVNGSSDLSPITVQTYDGARRAAYDYQFSATDGAWKPANITGETGMLLQSEQDAKVRMYGNEYIENAGESRTVQLTRYNNMEAWDSSNSGSSAKFTHLENMSWNMFGSPFLCAMNDQDMEYGRVIYEKNGDGFVPRNTTDQQGAIGAGSAVLTQSATLQPYEIFTVAQRKEETQQNEGRNTRLAVALAPQGQDGQDELTLTAVPTEEASEEFNMAADGVKMMTVGQAAQIYLERGGKQYAMLTALDLEGKIDVGVLVPESGQYSIFIPEDCAMEDYETVVLEDKATGRVVDLLEGGYDFQMDEAGTLNSRFTLSFNRPVDEDGLTRIRIQAMGNGQVRITGLTDGDQISAYQENGTMTYSQRVTSPEKNIALPGKVCLIKVVAADGREIVKKLVIR